jgi:hypothetical protein
MRTPAIKSERVVVSAVTLVGMFMTKPPLDETRHPVWSTPYHFDWESTAALRKIFNNRST